MNSLHDQQRIDAVSLVSTHSELRSPLIFAARTRAVSCAVLTILSTFSGCRQVAIDPVELEQGATARFGEQVAVLSTTMNSRGDAWVAVSAPEYLSPGRQSSSGAVFLCELATGALVRTIRNEEHIESFGAGLTTIGDLDGRGMQDLLVSGRSSTERPCSMAVCSSETGETIHSLRPKPSDTCFGPAVAWDPGPKGTDNSALLVAFSTRVDASHDVAGVRCFRGVHLVEEGQYQVDGAGISVSSSLAVLHSKTKSSAICILPIRWHRDRIGEPGEIHLVDIVTMKRIAVIQDPERRPGFAARVAVCGDLDGDGEDDALVLSKAEVPDRKDPNRLYLLRSSDRSITPLLASTSDGWGSSIERFGDIDGDGVEDFTLSDDEFDGTMGKTTLISGKTLKPILSWTGARDGHHFGSAAAVKFDPSSPRDSWIVVGTRPVDRVLAGYFAVHSCGDHDKGYVRDLSQLLK